MGLWKEVWLAGSGDSFVDWSGCLYCCLDGLMDVQRRRRLPGLGGSVIFMFVSFLSQQDTLGVGVVTTDSSVPHKPLSVSLSVSESPSARPCNGAKVQPWGPKLRP